MTHYLISDDLTDPQMGAADALRSLLSQGLCIERDTSLWPAVGTSEDAIEKRAKMVRLNQGLFHYRLNGVFSEAQAEAQRRLLAELGSTTLPMKSSRFMIILSLISIYLQELCDFDEDNGDYDHLIYFLEEIEGRSFFMTEMIFGHDESEQLIRVLRFFQEKPYWREDIQLALQYKLAYAYWLCAAHMKDVTGNSQPMPAWEPFDEKEIAEAIDCLVDFVEANPEFMVIC